MDHNEERVGIIYIISAYIIWGFLPIYWKLLNNVPADEILAHRMVWSCVLMLGIVLLSGKLSPFIQECKMIIKNKKKLLGITIASLVISVNWLTYIWSVNNDHIIQASLGYYINPLVSILLAVIVLKEHVTRRQIFSFVLAGVAVLNIAISYGVFPWLSLLLAFTFALYGLLKKMVDVDAMFGLAIETIIITPIALLYLFIMPAGSFITSSSMTTSFLLIGAGAATAVPLLLFAQGAKRIPLVLLGFLQYIAPTIMLMIGIFMFKETFSLTHFISFGLIWIALIIYMGSMQRSPKRRNKHT